MLHKAPRKLLRTKIVLSLLVVGFIPVLVGLMITYWNGTLKLRESMGANFQGQAAEAARITDLILEGEIESKKNLSTSAEIRKAIDLSNQSYENLSYQEIQGLLMKLSNQWEDETLSFKEEILHRQASGILRKYMITRDVEYLGFFVTDEKGALVASINGIPQFNHGSEAWWETAYNDGIGRTYIGDLERIEKGSEKFIVKIAMPVFDERNRKVIGVMAVYHIMAGENSTEGLISPSIHNIRFGQTGHAMLIDSEGRVLICPVMPTGTFITNKSLVETLTVSTSGWVIADDDAHGGKNSIIGFAPLLKTSEISKSSTGKSWHSFIRQEPKELYSPISSLLQSVAYSGIFLIGFVAVTGIILSKKLARPIQTLQEGAEAIGRGNLDVKLDVRTNDEIEHLAMQFNNMAEKLKESYSTLEQKVSDRTRQLSALNLIAMTTNRSLDLKKILEDTLDKVMEVMHFHAGGIRLLDDKTGKLVLLASRGLPLDIAQKHHEISVGEKFSGKAAALGQPIVIEGPQTSQGHDSPLLDIGMVSVVAIPLKAKEKVLGTLSGGCRMARTFSPQEIELLTSIAHQVSISIENATLFAQTKEMVKQLEESDRFKSEFFSNISHEFRTPLSAIIGYSELLMGRIGGELTPKQEEYISNIQTSGNLLLENINNLLDLSRIKAGKMGVHFGEFSVRTLIQSCIKAVTSLASKKKQSLEFKVLSQAEDYQAEDGELMINADEIKIKQILLNLLSNAIKFTPYGGKITVSAKTSTLNGEDAVELEVSDTGIGIKKEDQDKIFEEFKQADSSFTREYAGSGLGLTIVRRYVEMHGGKILLESQPDQGSRFIILLPRRIEPEWTLEERAAEEEALSLPTSNPMDDAPEDPSDRPVRKKTTGEGAVASSADPLTGLYQEDYFTEYIQNLSLYGRKCGNHSAFIMTRIPRFKRFNQSKGQAAGDALIHETAELIKRNLRDQDIFCRCYGSTFGIIARGTDSLQMKSIGKKLKGVVEVGFSSPASPDGKPSTLNVIVASVPEKPDQVKTLFKQILRAFDEMDKGGGKDVLEM